MKRKVWKRVLIALLVQSVICGPQALAQAQMEAFHAMPITAPERAVSHGSSGSELRKDADGFIYDLNGDLARMDLREIAKGDYFLSLHEFDKAYQSYMGAYETGSRNLYLLTQLGIVSQLRGDYASAVTHLEKVAKTIPAHELSGAIHVPYVHGYETPEHRSHKRAFSNRTHLSVIFYLLYAQHGAEDDAGLITTARKYYGPLVEKDHILLTLLAEAYARQHKAAQALAEVNKALTLPVNNPADLRDAYRIKGQLLLQTGKKTEGRELLSRAAALGDPKAQEALTKLQHP